MRVAVLDEHGGFGPTAGLGRLRTHADVRCIRAPAPDFSDLADCEVIIVNRGSTRFDRTALAALSNLRLLVQVGRRSDVIDLAAAAESGVRVSVVDVGFSIGTAELTIALMLAVMRRLVGSDTSIRRGVWHPEITPVVHGKTLGIIGLGRVGRHVARLANAFGMSVLASGPRLTEESARDARASCVDLDSLLLHSDVVTIHAPLNADTGGLLDARRLSLMKRSAYLVNTARGPIVAERALIDALQSNSIAGAALDVYDREPLPSDHPFMALPNVVLTPHAGWLTDEAYERFAAAAADVVIGYLNSLGIVSDIAGRPGLLR